MGHPLWTTEDQLVLLLPEDKEGGPAPPTKGTAHVSSEEKGLVPGTRVLVQTLKTKGIIHRIEPERDLAYKICHDDGTYIRTLASNLTVLAPEVIELASEGEEPPPSSPRFPVGSRVMYYLKKKFPPYPARVIA